LVSGTLSSDGLDARRRRLLFRSWHRGIREMDLILGRFVDRHLPHLSDAQLDEYERLIEVPDPLLYSWISGEAAAPAEFDSPLLHRLKRFHLEAGDTR
jgi:antitoxin CptB